MKLFEELRVYKFWAGIWPDVNNNFSSAGKTLENLTAELLTHTVIGFTAEEVHKIYDIFSSSRPLVPSV